jgi:hypothetical protein
MQRDSYDAFAQLELSNINVAKLGAWHTKRILTAINKRFKLKQTFRNPFTFKIFETINHSVFHPLFVAIRDHKIGGNRTEPSMKIKTVRDKPGRRGTKTVLYILTFTSLYSLTHVFTNLLPGEPACTYFYKKIRNCNVELIVSEEKPVVFTYRATKETLCVTGWYEVRNEFGVICSL